MARTKLVGFCAAFLLLLFVFAFGAFAASDDEVNITISFLGSGVVTVGDTEYDDFGGRFTFTAEVGETVTMTAAASEEFEFLFWLNSETNRVVSWNESYSFTAATYANYQVVFDTSESVAAEDDVHTVIYLSAGENLRSFQTVTRGTVAYYNNVPQNGLIVSGRTFMGWDHTPEQVAQKSGRVIVRPRYADDVYYTITTVVGDTVAEQSALYRAEVKIVAPSTLNGQDFSYWLAVSDDPNIPDQIASYYASYSFICTMDARFVAVYGQGKMSGIALRISGDVPNYSGYTITLHAEHSVTSDYTIIQHGMIVTEDVTIGNRPDLFVINASEPKIRKGTANNTQRAGTYSINISNWYVVDDTNGYYYPKKFARAYVIARDKNGVTQTVYSKIHCADYSSHAFDYDNFDDPF